MGQPRIVKGGNGMKKYNLFINNICEGQKITIAIQRYYGGIQILQGIYYKVESYLNPPIGIVIDIKHEKEHKITRYSIIHSTPLIVYNDYVDIENTDKNYHTITDIIANNPSGIIFQDIAEVTE